MPAAQPGSAVWLTYWSLLWWVDGLSGTSWTLPFLKLLRDKGQYLSRPDEKCAQSKLPATQAQKLIYANS